MEARVPRPLGGRRRILGGLMARQMAWLTATLPPALILAFALPGPLKAASFLLALAGVLAAFVPIRGRYVDEWAFDLLIRGEPREREWKKAPGVALPEWAPARPAPAPPPVPRAAGPPESPPTLAGVVLDIVIIIAISLVTLHLYRGGWRDVVAFFR